MPWSTSHRISKVGSNVKGQSHWGGCGELIYVKQNTTQLESWNLFCTLCTYYQSLFRYS